MLPKTFPSGRLPRSQPTRVRGPREGPLRSGLGLRAGQVVARLAERPRPAGSCGSASALSRISRLLGLSWKEPDPGTLAKVAD